MKEYDILTTIQFATYLLIVNNCKKGVVRLESIINKHEIIDDHFFDSIFFFEKNNLIRLKNNIIYNKLKQTI